MKCKESSEITAYLQGEGSEEERGMLRRHFDQCEACARELAQFERAFGALGKVETVEPSPDFQSRVEQAFLRAHPKFAPKPKFRLVHAASDTIVNLVDASRNRSRAADDASPNEAEPSSK